jgi:hypothetical protein
MSPHSPELLYTLIRVIAVNRISSVGRLPVSALLSRYLRQRDPPAGLNATASFKAWSRVIFCVQVKVVGGGIAYMTSTPASLYAVNCPNCEGMVPLKPLRFINN